MPALPLHRVVLLLGSHFGTAADQRRETVYFRLHTQGHQSRWKTAVTDPLAEFATARK